jgi:hypothetical protein
MKIRQNDPIIFMFQLLYHLDVIAHLNTEMRIYAVTMGYPDTEDFTNPLIDVRIYE